MEIIIEVEKLQKLFGISFIGGVFSDALLRFSPKGLIVNDPTVINGIIVVATFKPEYFIKYDVIEQENIIIPQSFYDIIKKKSFNAKEIKLYTTNTHLKIIAGKDTYSEPITSIEDDGTGILPDRVERTCKVAAKDYGIMPVKNSELTFVGKINLTDFNLPSGKHYILISDDDGLRFEVKITGNFKRKIDIIETKLTPTVHFTHKYDPTILNSMVKQFQGCVWVAINEDGFIFLTDKNSERSMLFVMGESE